MAVSVVNFTAAGFRWPTVGSTIDVPNPGSATTGDLVLLFLFRYDTYASGDVGTPGGLSGWTNLFDSAAADKRFGVWYKDWASGTNCATLSSLSTGAYYAYAAMAVRGHTTTGISYSSVATGTNTTVAGASLTAATGDLLISTLGIWDPFTSAAATVTHPSGMTSRVAGSSSNGVDLGGGYNYIQLYVDTESPSAGSTGTRSWVADDPAYNLAEMTVRNIIIPAAGATSHTADATCATTVSITPVAQASRVASADVASTASVSAAADVVRPTSADLAATVTITAEASVTRSASADLATTATVAAAGTVTTPGAASADAAVATTATITAEASVVRAATADLATTAAITAEASTSTPGQQSGTAAVATTATITATASVTRSASADLAATVTITASPSGITTRGTMRPIDRATARIRPTGASGTTIRTHVIAFDRATMRAVLDDYATTAPGGVLCFVGPDDPLTVGLVAPGVAHLWFHDGTVSEREGT